MTHGQVFTGQLHITSNVSVSLSNTQGNLAQLRGFSEIQKYLEFFPYILYLDLKDYLLSHKAQCLKIRLDHILCVTEEKGYSQHMRYIPQHEANKTTDIRKGLVVLFVVQVVQGHI